MSRPVVAIVGKPNVGKSALFNKLTGHRTSIVEDTPGITRDRIYGECDWNGRKFTIIDTGGIEQESSDMILNFMRRQAEIAIDTADVIIFMTDIRTGVTASDHEVTSMLLKSKKPIVLAVNKIDSIGEPPLEFYEFYNLGLGDPIALSAVHGNGTGDLLDRCVEHFPDGNEEDEDAEIIKVAVIGKPNAGKSSLINKILGEERVIVSSTPGTTRDAIDTYFENKHGKFMFIDTAGIRKKSRMDSDIEKYSVLRAYMAVERADVCLIMIDATEGATEQDTKIAGFANEKGKANILLVNKWDLVDKDEKTMDKMRSEVKEAFKFMDYAPVHFISAKTGQRVERLFDLIKYCFDQNAIRISTGVLNDVLAEATAKVQPPSDKGRRLKIYYITQPSTKPPTFVVFANSIELFHYSYRRYIENQIRSVFGLEGTPIRLIIREKGDKSS